MISFCKMNKENCINIIMIMIVGLAGYIIIIVGITSICFQKVFELYNDKLNNINKLLLELKDEQCKKKNKIIKGKDKDKGKDNEIFV